MASLCDYIEHYLKSLMERSKNGVVEIQRNELAEQFACVPSQINYVLDTRFGVERGYVVESRRGGGGFVRIIKVRSGSPARLLGRILDEAGRDVTQDQALSYVDRLEEESLISSREALLMRAVVDRAVISLDLPYRDRIRSKILRAMIMALLSKSSETVD